MTARGVIKSIAIRSKKNGPMQVIDSAQIVEGGGITADIKVSPRRGVTFISAEDWQVVQQELNAPDLPWHTRRANVLVEGLDMGSLIDKRIKVGDAIIRINDRTRPCELMDELKPGLRDALEPDHRAGVFGSVEKQGACKPGDAIEVLAD